MPKRSSRAPTWPRAVAWPSTAIIRWMRERVSGAGGDPDDIPDISPVRFLRVPEVLQLIGVCTSTLYRMINAGEFPRPIPIDRAASRRAA